MWSNVAGEPRSQADRSESNAAKRLEFLSSSKNEPFQFPAFAGTRQVPSEHWICFSAPGMNISPAISTKSRLHDDSIWLPFQR
jgi:hypothetical protein